MNNITDSELKVYFENIEYATMLLRELLDTPRMKRTLKNRIIDDVSRDGISVTYEEDKDVYDKVCEINALLRLDNNDVANDMEIISDVENTMRETVINLA